MKKLLIVVFALTCLCFQCNTCVFPGRANITVVDRNHQPVSGATITVKNQSNHVVGSGNSDSNGIYPYEESNIREEVLEIVVDSKDNLRHGAAVVGIKPGEDLELTIMLD
jgi:hypothetical protein